MLDRGFCRNLVFFLFITGCFLTTASGEDNFTRGNVGARYIALGKAAEVASNDIFLIYWNPAGLADLAAYREQSLSYTGKIKDDPGDDNIQIGDLTDFSRKNADPVRMGASFCFLNGRTGFLGAAFNALDGVIGAGLYNFYSGDDGGDTISGDTSGTGVSSAYLAFGRGFGAASLGFTLKARYEDIDDHDFYGFGADAGAVVEVIPLVKTGLIIQDLVMVRRPVDEKDKEGEKYDFVPPAVKASASINGVYDFTIAFTGIKFLDGGYEFNYGLGYSPVNRASINIGLNDYRAFCAGFSCGFYGGEFSYAFSYHREDKDVINIISIIYEI